MPLQLRVVATGQIIEVPNEGQTLGREGGQADIQLKDGSLSSRHARIFADGMEWLIQDLGSTNGTYVGETRITATTEIHPNDMISMSTTTLEVVKVWDPQLQHTVMVAAPVFETQPTVAAVSRTPAPKGPTAPSPVIVVNPAPGPEEDLDAPTARTLISKAVRPVVQEEEEPVVPSAPTMIGQAGMTAEELENANAPSAARTMIGYGEPSAPAAPAAMKTMIGYGAVPSAPAGSKTMIGYGAEPSAPAAARTMIGYGPSSSVSVQDNNDEATPPPTDAAEDEAVAQTREVVRKPRGSQPEAAPETEGSDKGVKYFLVAVPKAIAFYLAAIPLMIVNPIGTIRKGVEEQKHEAKGKMELIAYALPVNLFSAAVGFLSTLIVQIVTGTVSIGGLIVGTLIIPAIVAVVASVITGYAWHPVTGWLIGKLKGESDERSRTNYFLMFMTATALVVLPGAIGTLLGLVPFRLVAMVQPILSALGSVVLIFVTYSWMTKFDVVKWFRTVLLVLGGLALVGGVFGALGRLTTTPGGVVGSDVNAQIAAAQKQADEAMKAAGEASDDAQDAVKEANAAVKEANAAVKDSKAAVKEAEAEEKQAEAEVKVAAKEAAAEAKPSVKEVAPAVAEGSVTYPAYVKMRDAVEKTIADDPALLNRSPELLALYRGYTKSAFEIDSKFDELDAKNPADTKLNVRLREAELFAKNEKAISALYAKLKPSGKAEAPVAKEEKPKAEAKAAPAAKEEKPKAEAKPAPAAKEEKPKPAPVAKEEKPKAEPKPAPAAKEEKPKAVAEAKPAPAAKEEKPKAEAKPAGKGKLACSSKPAQADIWVDGKNTGKKTPLAVSSALELPAGKHTVIFKLNGKSSAPQEIVIEAGGQVVLKGVEIPGA